MFLKEQIHVPLSLYASILLKSHPLLTETTILKYLYNSTENILDYHYICSLWKYRHVLRITMTSKNLSLRLFSHKNSFGIIWELGNEWLSGLNLSKYNVQICIIQDKIQNHSHQEEHLWKYEYLPSWLLPLFHGVLHSYSCHHRQCFLQWYDQTAQVPETPIQAAAAPTQHWGPQCPGY